MVNMIFRESVHVELQGEQALTYIPQDDQVAKYRINGFEEPLVHIHDYRRIPLNALEQALKTGNLLSFSPIFNSPALMLIKPQETAELVIELHESDISDPDLRLWIAIGIRETIPVYDYLWNLIAPWGDDAFAFLALYRLKTRCQKLESAAFLASSTPPGLSLANSYSNLSGPR